MNAHIDHNDREAWLRLGCEVLDIEMQGLAALKDHLGGSFYDALALLAACPGRVAVSGVGKSGLVGRKIAATFASTGTPAFFLHPVEGQHGDLGALRPGDVLIALSNSGATEELLALLPAIRSLGLRIVALTGRIDSPLARMADVALDASVPREACPLGLAPTSSTTAALALGDALAICLMRWKNFTEKDFKSYHPGGSLGKRLQEKVGAVLTGALPVSPAARTLGEALKVLNQGGYGAVILTGQEGKAEGVLTDGDVRRLVCAGGLRPEHPASEVMTRSFASAAPEESVGEVLEQMERRAITVMPVLDREGRAVGIAHLHDLLGKGKIGFTG